MWTAPVDRLKRNGRHLVAMLDDVLELLRAESNQFTVSPGMRRLSIAVDEALADVEVNAAARGMDIVNEVAGAAGDPLYWGDERGVRQIVVNLLTNAIKCTASGGRMLDVGAVFPDSVQIHIRALAAWHRQPIGVAMAVIGILPRSDEMPLLLPSAARPPTRLRGSSANAAFESCRVVSAGGNHQGAHVRGAARLPLQLIDIAHPLGS